LERSSISESDVVYEIGAGQGIITKELLKKSKKVVAFEIDKELFDKLERKFQKEKSLELTQGDFLSYKLPKYPYKVFSNIPFNITSAIVSKLVQAENPPTDAYLIVQKEAAKRFTGKPYDKRNSQVSILLKPWFNVQILREFERDDFFPRPEVDTVLLRIKRRDNSLVATKNRKRYEDFVVYTFNQFKPNVIEGLSEIFGNQTVLKLAKGLNFSPKSKPSELSFEHWLGLFSYFINELDNNKRALVNDSYETLLQQQKKLDKIHRTRTDKNWKKYRN